MNRYHMAILFCGIAMAFFALFGVRFSLVKQKEDAEKQLKDTLHFAVSCATNTLASKYGSSDDCYAISNNFFTALSVLNDDQSISNGRIFPEDFYPHVPIMLLLEERNYHLGHFDGTRYIWDKNLPYNESNQLMSEIEPERILFQIETLINEKIKEYHDGLSIADEDYVLPDYTMRNLKPGTILVVLENFPITLNGQYYSGIYSEAGTITD